MKNTIVLLIILAAFLCSRSDGMKCDDKKFPQMSTLAVSKPKKLAKTLCNKLITDADETELHKECVSSHKKYFKLFDVDEGIINKYVDFCKNHPFQDNSCAVPKNSIKLINHLSRYCWTLEDIAESNEYIFNEDVTISPDDWKLFSNITNIDLPSCLSQITSDGEFKETKENSLNKYQNLSVLKNHESFLKTRKKYCNCGEVIGFDAIYEVYSTYTHYNHIVKDKNTFLEHICIKSEKKYFWKKEQLDAIRIQGRIENFVKKYIVDYQNLANFFTDANILASTQWFSSDPYYENSKWPVVYVFMYTMPDIGTRSGKQVDCDVFGRGNTEGCKKFDTVKVEIVAKAIFYNFTVELYQKFVAITTNLTINTPFNIWECRKLVIDAFFDYEKKFPKNSRAENDQYGGSKISFATTHLNLFIQLKPEAQYCDEFSRDVRIFLETFNSYRRKLMYTHVSRLLNLAIDNGKRLENATECLKFSSAIERQLSEKKMFKDQPRIEKPGSENTTTDDEDERLDDFGKKLFGKKEIYDSCNGNGKPDVKIITNVLKMLYSEEELEKFFNIPGDNTEVTEGTSA